MKFIKYTSIFCFILKAAHCIHQKQTQKKLQPRDIVVIFVAHDEAEKYQLSPDEIFVHNDWNPLTTDNEGNLALLKFTEGKIRLNTFIEPICIWNSENEVNNQGLVIRSSENTTESDGISPLEVTASIKPKNQCFTASHVRANLSSSRTFCGTAGGDSGGGYFIKVFYQYQLAGVESSSCQYCDSSENVIYTNVTVYKDWIEKLANAPKTKKGVKNLREVSCEIKMCKPQICVLSNTIASEDYVLGSDSDSYVEEFDIQDNENVKYLPRHIGEKIPNLNKFVAIRCGLTVIRDFYFENMVRLEDLFLNENRIAMIEPGAFVDLTQLKSLYLNENLIETFDEKLFQTMVALESINFSYNRIKFLSPSTLEIPGARITYVELLKNICIDNFYNAHSPGSELLEQDLIANCTQGWVDIC